MISKTTKKGGKRTEIIKEGGWKGEKRRRGEKLILHSACSWKRKKKIGAYLRERTKS